MKVTQSRGVRAQRTSRPCWVQGLLGVGNVLAVFVVQVWEIAAHAKMLKYFWTRVCLENAAEPRRLKIYVSSNNRFKICYRSYWHFVNNLSLVMRPTKDFSTLRQMSLEIEYKNPKEAVATNRKFCPFRRKWSCGGWSMKFRFNPVEIAMIVTGPK